MKQKTRFALALLTLTVSFVAATALAKYPDCAAGEVHFACPKYFKTVTPESGQQFTLFHYRKYNVGLFVASTPSNFHEEPFMASVIKTSLAKLFPRDSQSFAWKTVPDSSSISKFEIGRTVMLGFNGSLSVLIKYRRLNVNGRDIIVGYASHFGKGSEGKEAFDRGLGGDSMPGCYAVVEVIYSITGEKMPENNPCDLVGIIG